MNLSDEVFCGAPQIIGSITDRKRADLKKFHDRWYPNYEIMVPINRNVSDHVYSAKIEGAKLDEKIRTLDDLNLSLIKDYQKLFDLLFLDYVKEHNPKTIIDICDRLLKRKSVVAITFQSLQNFEEVDNLLKCMGFIPMHKDKKHYKNTGSVVPMYIGYWARKT